MLWDKSIISNIWNDFQWMAINRELERPLVWRGNRGSCICSEVKYEKCIVMLKFATCIMLGSTK